jgi:hypothetical protein
MSREAAAGPGSFQGGKQGKVVRDSRTNTTQQCMHDFPNRAIFSRYKEENLQRIEQKKILKIRREREKKRKEKVNIRKRGKK